MFQVGAQRQAGVVPFPGPGQHGWGEVGQEQGAARIAVGQQVGAVAGAAAGIEEKAGGQLAVPGRQGGFQGVAYLALQGGGLVVGIGGPVKGAADVVLFHQAGSPSAQACTWPAKATGSCRKGVWAASAMSCSRPWGS